MAAAMTDGPPDSKKRSLDSNEAETEAAAAGVKRTRLIPWFKNEFRQLTTPLAGILFGAVPVVPVCEIIVGFCIQRDFTRCIGECTTLNPPVFGGRCIQCGAEDQKELHAALWESVTCSRTVFRNFYDKLRFNPHIRYTQNLMMLIDNFSQSTNTFMNSVHISRIYSIFYARPPVFHAHPQSTAFDESKIPSVCRGTGEGSTTADECAVLCLLALVDRCSVPTEQVDVTMPVFSRRLNYMFRLYRYWTANELSDFLQMSSTQRLTYLYWFHEQLKLQSIISL